MAKPESRTILFVALLLAFSALIFTIVDWRTGGFEFLKPQKYSFYFQSWVSLAGVVFTSIMALSTFIIYQKNKIAQLKYVSLSFVLISVAYLLLGYHSSYCEVCSNLTMCSASHNYPNYLTIIALTLFVLLVLLANINKSIASLKVFSVTLIIASLLVLLTLFFSIRFMETPTLTPYLITTINLQGFIFLLPLIGVVLLFIYFRNTYKVSNTISFLFLLLILSFLPQAFHLFVCDECHKLECSEFYALSGIMMTVAIGCILYSIRLQLEDKTEG